MERERRKVVAVIGSGSATEEEPGYQAASIIGRSLVDNGFRVMTGGLHGVMEGAFIGAKSSKRYREGDTIAVLPGIDPDDANMHSDIVIPTGLGIGRNMIVTNADAIIAIGGGSGTLSEIAFSWQKGKTIVALDIPGWSGELGGRALDDRRPDDVVIKAKDPHHAVELMMSEL